MGYNIFIVRNFIQKIKQDRHRYLLWFWVLMIVPTLVWWKDSVLWVALMSLYANIEASAAARNAEK